MGKNIKPPISCNKVQTNAQKYVDENADVKDEFDKEKLKKYFKKHKKMQINYDVERFSPTLENGLSSSQVKTRFQQFLFNQTNKNYSKSIASIFIENIFTFFNLLCLLAGIALIIAGTQGITNYLVLIITSANIAIGIIQEIRSKLAIDKLSLMSQSTTNVIRDGKIIEIPSTDVVLDDLILLELGNQVPADCTLAEGSVEVNESLLTGESVAVKKNVGDTVYAGSFISSGNGKFRVQKVGKETYVEQLTAKAKKYKRPNSELMNSTKGIIKVIACMIVPIAIFTFFINLKNYSPETAVGVEAFIFSKEINFAIQRTCTVVIGMIPSGMLLLTSVALALGVINLARSNTMVRDMYSLEMLARVNVLCLDKTGTITDGKMKVSACSILKQVDDYSLNDIIGSMVGALNDNNQTSIALMDEFGVSDKLTATEKIPFSSKRKLSAVTFKGVGTFCIGAPEFVLKPYPENVEKMVNDYAKVGLRVVILAHSPKAISGNKLPSNLKAVALIALADNVREEAIETVKWFKENDVSVKVISGDNPVTVSEVAKRAGIVNAEKFISLEGFSDEQIQNVACDYTVFGRVSPEQKAILIKALKSNGNTVGMTGDGVNDILALKEADCAVSVASGSDAARNVSHLVLMDNNFNSMPKVVAEGRKVINNIKNSSSLFLMKTAFTAILATICIILQIPYLFMPSNILLMECCVIGIPSFLLALQSNHDRVQGKYITHVLTHSISGALLMLLCVMSVYVLNQINILQYNNYEFDKNVIAMCMIVFTFSGMVMLFRLCQPFNLYRTCLVIGMLAVVIIALSVPFLGDMLYLGWSGLEWNYTKVITLIAVILASFPLSEIFIKIINFIIPNKRKSQT